MQRCSKSLPLNSFVLPVAILLVARNLRTRVRLQHPHHGLAPRTIGIVGLTLVVMCSTRLAIAEHSVARVWNEQLLHAISLDTARPTVHARNLFHLSAAMYDAWAAYDDDGGSSTCIMKRHRGGHRGGPERSDQPRGSQYHSAPLCTTDPRASAPVVSQRSPTFASR